MSVFLGNTCVAGRFVANEDKLNEYLADVKSYNDKIATCESKVSTCEGKVATCETNITTCEGRVDTCEDNIKICEEQIDNLETTVSNKINNYNPSGNGTFTMNGNILINNNGDLINYYNKLEIMEMFSMLGFVFSGCYDSNGCLLKALTISDFDENYSNIKNHISTLVYDNTYKLILPEGFTSIASNAFKEWNSLSIITIPNNIVSIGDNAFSNCSSLSSINLSDSITNIGVGAFRDCSNLESITLPNKLTTLNNYLFQNCIKLISITIPSSVTSIGLQVFSDCSKLKTVRMSNNISSMGAFSFYNCTSLSSLGGINSGCDIELSNSIIIPEMCFAYTDLENISIPNGISRIEEKAFCYCNKMKSLYIPGSVKFMSNYSFYGSTPELTADNYTNWYLDNDKQNKVKLSAFNLTNNTSGYCASQWYHD